MHSIAAVSYTHLPYTDYIGAGHSQGISVKTSSDLISQDWPLVASGYKTLDGKGLEGRAAEVSRFLDHATFGATLEEIWSLQNKTFSTWIDEQMATPRSDYTTSTNDIFRYLYDYYLSQGKAAMLTNIGTLLEPITKVQYEQNKGRVPLGLFSHSDQSNQWQTAISDNRITKGWAGRMADLMYTVNSNDLISMNISL